MINRNDIPIAAKLHCKNGETGSFMSTLKQRTNWKPTKSNPLVLAPQNNPSKGGRRNINRARLMMSVRNMRLCLCSLTTSAWYGLVLVWTISGANRKAGMKARIGGFACCKALYLLYPKQESKLRLKCCCSLFYLGFEVKRANLNWNTQNIALSNCFPKQ